MQPILGGYSFQGGSCKGKEACSDLASESCTTSAVTTMKDCAATAAPFRSVIIFKLMGGYKKNLLCHIPKQSVRFSRRSKTAWGAFENQQHFFHSNHITILNVFSPLMVNVAHIFARRHCGWRWEETGCNKLRDIEICRMIKCKRLGVSERGLYFEFASSTKYELVRWRCARWK